MIAYDRFILLSAPRVRDSIYAQTVSRTGQRTPSNAKILMQKKLRFAHRVYFAMNSHFACNSI